VREYGDRREWTLNGLPFGTHRGTQTIVRTKGSDKLVRVNTGTGPLGAALPAPPHTEGDRAAPGLRNATSGKAFRCGCSLAGLNAALETLICVQTSRGLNVNPTQQAGRVASGATTRRFRLRQRGLTCVRSIGLIFACADVDLARAEEPPSPQVIVSACRPTAGLAAFEGQDPKVRKAEMNKGGAFLRAGNLHAIAGDTERAIEQYDRAIRLNPENAIYCYSRGLARLKSRDFERAREDFHQAAALNPRSSMAFFGRGQAHVGTNEYDRAIEDFSEAIKLLPGNSAAYAIRAGAYIAKREYDRAIDDLDRAIKLDPLCYVAFNSRGLVQDLKGERDRATADYNRSIELSLISGTAETHVWRSHAYQRKRDYERAMLDLDQALKLDPRNIPALNNRCYVQALAGAFDKALAYCNEALRIRPGNASILDSRGFTYLKMGSLDDAIAAYDAALRIDRKKASALYGRGTAKRLKGATAGGDADIAAAKAIRPSIADEMAQVGIN
jgi:tetratricopeptide (TPR) repeat protein